MKQKDYKEIANIMWERIAIIKAGKMPNTTLVYTQLKAICDRLADYFEKEDKIRICNLCGQPVKNLPNGGAECVVCNSYPYKNQLKNYFNKEQFLKDCGVEE